MRTVLFISAFLAIAIALFFTTDDMKAAEDGGEVNLYYSGKEYLIRPLLDSFTAASGITVNVVTGKKAGLITRIEQEGKHSPADVLMTVDIGNIYQAKEKGLIQSITSETLTNAIPRGFRGEDDDWFGVSLRARAIIYAKDRVKPEQLSSYAALAAPEWKNRVLIRSSSNVYNQSLMASIIEHEGKDASLNWAKAIVANFARDPKGGDTDQIRAIAAGEGDIAIANSYYYARLVNSKEPADQEVASKVSIFFPNQDDRGTHINIRGGGVVKHAKNKENAIKLLEYMVSDDVQHFLTNNNYEFPIRSDIAWTDTLKNWGDIKFDQLHLTNVGANNKAAVMTFDKAGWK